MLWFIIAILVVSALLGDDPRPKKWLRLILTCIAIIYGIRLIVTAGLHLLPIIIIVWAIVDIILPFLRGFISRF